MSSLMQRRASAARSVPTMRSLTDQLDRLRGALIHVATQPDSPVSRAALRALCLSAAFVIDSNSRHDI